MRRGAVLALAVAAAAFAGCGGNKATIKVSSSASGSIPTAKEPVSGFVKRLTAIEADIQAGRCGPVSAFNKQSGFALFCDARGKLAYSGFKVLGTEVFGTGGILEFTDAEVKKTSKQKPTPGVKAKGNQEVGVLTLAVAPDGRYTPTGPASPILNGSVIGTKPASWAGADANAVIFLKAIRDKDCKAFFRYSITPRGLPEKQACKQGLDTAYAALHKDLTSGQKATLFRQSGNAQFYFYGLRTGKQFRTLVVAKNPPPGPAFLAFGTFRATK